MPNYYWKYLSPSHIIGIQYCGFDWKRIYLAGYIKFQAKKEQKIGETTEYHSSITLFQAENVDICTIFITPPLFDSLQ